MSAPTSPASSASAALVRETPLVPAPALGPLVWLKLENQQRTGSFKLRGACRKLDAMPAAERARGVVTASAGNHGAGVALAAQLLGIPVTVLCPRTVPAVKKANMERAGAIVVAEAEHYDDAEARARKLAAERGVPFVSPFDDEDVIAGNGDGLAAEIVAQRPDVAQVVCPAGGGGLLSGLARSLAPRGVRVVGAQPEKNCAMFESLRLGRALTVYEGEPTLAEGCEGAVAERTYAIVRDAGARVVTVTEAQIRAAVAFAYRALGQTIEASAAVPIAALRAGAVEATVPTVLVLTGGNIDAALLDQLLAE